METEKKDMPTADCSFIAAYHQHFCPKLPSYGTQNQAISIQLQLEEALPEWLCFQTARSPLARPVPWPLSHYKQRQLQEDRLLLPGSFCGDALSHQKAVGRGEAA